MTISNDLFDERLAELAAQMPPPPPVDHLQRLTRARRRRHRAMTVAALISAVALATPVVRQLTEQRAQKLVFSASPGSLDMPATFIPADPQGDIFLIESSTGRVIRKLYSHPGLYGFESLAADATHVFVSDEQGIHEVPRAGGAPSLLTHEGGYEMAVSPDGTRLAGATAAPASPGGSGGPITVMVMNVTTRAIRTWTVPSPTQSAGSPTSASLRSSRPSATRNYADLHRISQLGWTGPEGIAAIITTVVGPGASIVHCPSTPTAQERTYAVPAAGCTEVQAPLPPVPSARLALFNLRSEAAPTTLDIPGGDAGWVIEAAPLLAVGTQPGTLITTLQDGSDTNPRLAELTVKAHPVDVRTIAVLAQGDAPQSLDNNKQDLLLSRPSGRVWTFLRITNGQPVVPAVIGDQWSAFAHW